MWRNNGRIPILSYHNRELNITIWRSSEPDLQILTKRCLDDENYLKAINPVNDNYSTLYIFSA